MMTLNDIQKRFLLFILGCIGVRLFMVFVSKNGQDIHKQLLGYFLTVISVGIMTIYLFNLRTTGSETMGSSIWWNSLRPIHSIIWGLAAYYLFTQDSETAWKILLGDVVLGLLTFLYYHWSQGNFSRLN
jgi:hypothetical protein